MNDLISRQAAIDAISEGVRDDAFLLVASIKSKINKVPPAQHEKLYTKADYIMALRKEYGCSLTRAEEAHSKAVAYLEYLQNEMMMKGGKNE